MTSQAEMTPLWFKFSNSMIMKSCLFRLFFIIILFTTEVSAQRTAPSEILAEEARALFAEGSLTLAIEKFRAAIEAAPEETDIMPLRIDLVQAQVREFSSIRDRQQRQRRNETLSNTLNELRELIQSGDTITPRELRVIEIQIELYKKIHSWRTSPLLRETGNRLAGQPNTPANVDRLVRFLRRQIVAGENHYNVPLELQNLFEAIINRSSDPEVRAWAGFALTQNNSVLNHVGSESLRRWEKARELAQQTSYSPLVEAGWFIWRMNTGWSDDRELNSPIDIPALVTTSKEHHEKLLGLEAHFPLRNAYLASLTRLISDWNSHVLAIGVAEHYSSGFSAEFSITTAGLDEISFELYRLPLPETQAWIDRQVPPPGDRARLLIGSWSVKHDDAPEFGWHSDVHQFDPSLEPGFYILSVTGMRSGSPKPSVEIRRFTVGSAQAALVLHRNPTNPHEILVTDSDSGSPLAGVDLAILIHGEDKTSWTARTDADGRAAGFPLPQSQPRGGSLNILGEADGQPIVARGFHRGRPKDLTADLLLDRPLYRPGETVHWNIVIRDRGDAVWQVPEYQDWTITFTDDEGEVLKSFETVNLDSFGTVSGELLLPVETKPGYLNFSIMSKKWGKTDLQSVCAVDNFIPPALTADITYSGPNKNLRPGEELETQVTVEYYSGGPAVGATVELTISQHTITTFEELYRNQRQIEPLKLSAETNAEGVASFVWRADKAENVGIKVAMSANILPQGGQPIQTTTSWDLTSSGLILEREDSGTPQLVRPNQSLKFEGRILNGAAQPVPFRGTAEVIQLSWRGAYFDENGTIVDHHAIPSDITFPSLPKQWKLLHEGYNEKVINSQFVETAADGRFQVEFNPPHVGLYAMRLIDGSGHIVSRAKELYDLYRSATGNSFGAETPFQFIVADESTAALPLHRGANRLIAPEAVQIGEQLRALLVTPNPESPTLISVVREQNSQSSILPAGPKLRWINLDSSAARIGAGQLIVSELANSYTKTHQFDILPINDDLNIAISAPSETRPGERKSIKFAVTDAEGSPTQAQITFVAADESLLDLSEEDDYFTDSAFNYTSVFSNATTIKSPRPSSPTYYPARDDRKGAVTHTYAGSNPRAGDEDEIVLSPFSIETQGDGGYRATSTLAGTRLNTPLRDIASAISLGSSEFLSDTGGVLGNFSSSTVSPVRIRRHFASTAAWIPAISTDQHGIARIEVTFPDNLTSWSLQSYAIGPNGDDFSTADTSLRSDLPFQARLQIPRFLVAGDTTNPSVVLVNRTSQQLRADTQLEIEGQGKLTPATTQTIQVPAHSEKHVSWTLRTESPGIIELTGSANSPDDADGEQRSLVVHEDGILQELAATTRLPPTSRRAEVELHLPTPLDQNRTTASIQVTTSPAIAAIDALPYLIDYPYGCVEQTMSRFLPAIVVRHALTRLGLDATEVENRILNSETSADVTRREAIAGISKLDEVTSQALARLTTAQTYSGGFGWWPDAVQDDPWMTAYVTWGLGLAMQAGVDVSPSLAESTLYRSIEIAEDSDNSIDTRAWALAACASHSTRLDDFTIDEVLSEVFAQRRNLTPSGRAVLALATARFGTDEQRGIIIRNLANQTVREDGDTGTLIHWGETSGHWNALDSANEATALSLLALFELDPDHEFIEPAISWLSLNRRSAHWESTRDTTFAVLALIRHLGNTNQSDILTAAHLELNGRALSRIDLSAKNLLAQPITIELPPEKLSPGINTISVRRSSRKDTTPLYVTALAETWATGNSVQPASHLIDVSRHFERLTTTPTVLGPVRTVPEKQPRFGTAEAGEQVNARLVIEVPHELHYVMVKVPKPAGCEPLNPLSGWDATISRLPHESVPDSSARYQNQRSLYREEHDDHSAFFIDQIQPGSWEINFALRAVTPGDYRALPASIEAMYVPEVRANSDSRRLTIE